jgi:hypothetical protein
MKRVLTTAAILGLAALASASGALARTTASTCPSGPLAAYVTYGVGSDPITGNGGTVWANGTYTRTLLIYRYSATKFCTLWRDSGSFTTVDGPSPGGTGLVAAGIKGAMTRNSVSTVFEAQWKGTAQTSGSLGAYPEQIDWLSLYFDFADDASKPGVAYAAGLFQSPLGCWSYKSGPLSAGDVVTTKLP